MTNCLKFNVTQRIVKKGSLIYNMVLPNTEEQGQ
jgi:hypothetical protein